MASKAELMAAGLPGAVATKLGVDGGVNTATAAGTTQGTATTLTSNFVNVTTSTIGGGVIIGLPFERNFVWNSGPNTLTVYPPVGGTVIGLAQNVGVTVAANSGVFMEGDGINFLSNVAL